MHMSLADASIWHLRTAARTLRRNPGFTVTALVMLSLGIGTVSALFSVVDKVLLEPLPYPQPERLVQVITTSRIGRQTLLSIPKYIYLREVTTSFESLAAYDSDGPEASLAVGGHRAALKTARVSADYFQLFGARLALGEMFTAGEDSPGGANAVIISDRIWRRYLRADLNVIGRELLLDDVSHKVVGVLAPASHLEPPADIWLPLRADWRSQDHIARVQVVARLRPGVSFEAARMEVHNKNFSEKFSPGTQFGAPLLFGEQFEALPLRDAVVGDVRPALYLLMGAVGFVLAICVANTATLVLARASRRTREIAVRMAAGAQRSQILFQLLSESLLLSLTGGIGSLVVAHLAVRAVLAVSPADLPRIGANGSAITLDWNVFLFTLFVSVAIGILCGLFPAVKMSRTDIGVLIKESSAQSDMTSRRNRWRSHLIIVEISSSLVLLVGAGLLIRTLVARRAVDRGFDEQNIVTLDMSLSSQRFSQTEEVAQLVNDASRRIQAIRGVKAVAATCALPLTAGVPMPFTILKNDHSQVGIYDGTASWRSVSPGYFKVFQIRLMRGRMLTDNDNEHAPGVVLINRAMQKKYWQAIDANPIGDFIAIGRGLGPSDHPRQIIGVVADVRDAGNDREPAMYVPVSQVSDWMNARTNRLFPLIWTVRTDGTQPSPVAAIEQELDSLSGSQPLGQPRTMRERIAASSARTQFYMTLLTVFAVIALALAAAGLYGLMAYSVQQRGRELAIRSALGASPRDIQELVMLQALRLALWGTLAGVPAALALSRVTISLVFGIETWDPATLGLVAFLLCAASLSAAYVPSVQASRVNPAAVLRAEG